MSLLEICVEDAAGIRAAVEGGADRIELCTALDLGGLTPSIGLAEISARAGVPARAIIRPRAGGFSFSADDEKAMHRDITCLLACGIEGVVLGASRSDGSLDVRLLGRLIETARTSGARGLTLHRAFDLTPDMDAAVAEAASLGFDCILTSGGELTAPAAVAVLARLRRLAPASLYIMAGSGITPANVASLVAETGVTAVHASARSDPEPADPTLVRFGFSATQRHVTDRAIVAALRRALDVNSTDSINTKGSHDHRS